MGKGCAKIKETLHRIEMRGNVCIDMGTWKDMEKQSSGMVSLFEPNCTYESVKILEKWESGFKSIQEVASHKQLPVPSDYIRSDGVQIGSTSPILNHSYTILNNRSYTLRYRDYMLYYSSFTIPPLYIPVMTMSFFKLQLMRSDKETLSDSSDFSFSTVVMDDELHRISKSDALSHCVNGECSEGMTTITEWDGMKCCLDGFQFNLENGLRRLRDRPIPHETFQLENSLLVMKGNELVSKKEHIQEIVFMPGSLVDLTELSISEWNDLVSIVFLPFCDSKPEAFNITLMGKVSPLEIAIINCPKLKQVIIKDHACMRGSSLQFINVPEIESLNIGSSSRSSKWQYASCCFNRCQKLDISSG